MIVEYFLLNYVPMGREIKINEAVFADGDVQSHYNHLYSGMNIDRKDCGYNLDKYILCMVTAEENCLVIECVKTIK